MNPLVLYGAGGNVHKAYTTFARKNRLPVCICDGDPEKTNTFKQIDTATLDILSLPEVINRYPDADFYVTPNRPIKYDIIETLIKFEIDQDRIINFEPYTKTKNMICSQFLETMTFQKKHLLFCCTSHHQIRVPKVLIDGSDEDLLSHWEQVKERVIHDLVNGNMDGYCANCPEARLSYLPASTAGKIETISFGAGGFICQFRCCYCDYKHIQHPSKEELMHYTKRVLAFVEYLKTRGVMDESTNVILLADGELSIHPMEADIIETYQYNPCTFLTNGAVYSSNIEKVLDRGKSKVLTSLDCGTKETFEFIKGRSCFKRVCTNIKRYAQHGPIELKYILMPGKNDGMADIEGFLDFADEVNATVIITRDLFGTDEFEKHIDRVLKAVSYLVNGGRDRNLTITVLPNLYDGLSTEDRIIEAICI